MIFRGNNRIIFPVHTNNDDNSLHTLYPRQVWSTDANCNLTCHSMNTTDSVGICTYYGTYQHNTETVVSNPPPFFYFNGSTVITQDGMHCIANPSLPSDILSCDYLLYIDAVTSKSTAPLWSLWSSRISVGTAPVYTKDGLTYNLLQADVPAITLGQLSGSSNTLCAYSSCILSCNGCEPVCAYSFGSVTSSVQGACIKSTDISKRSSQYFKVYTSGSESEGGTYRDCYYISEWSTSSIVEAVGGAIPYLMIGINKLSGYTTGGCYMYYNDLALAIEHPRA